MHRKLRFVRPLTALLVVLALATAACNKDDNELEVDVDGSTGITVIA